MTTAQLESAETPNTILSRLRDASFIHPLFAFLITRTIVLLGGYLGEIAIPGITGEGLYHVAPNNVFLDIWARWDSGFYLEIVNEGYKFIPDQISSVAFFPLYPLLVKLTSLITGNVLFASIIVSNLSLLGGLIFLYKLAELEFDADTAQRTVYYIAAFPTAFFFSAVYTESTYLLVSVAAVYFARRKLWAWATLFALLTSVTRIIGLGIWGIVGLEWLRTHGWTLTTIYRADAWRNLWQGLRTDWHNLAIILTAPLGLLTHMRFLNKTFGDPIAFWTIQSAWEREDLGFIRIIARDLTPVFSQNFGTGDIWWHVILDLSAFFFAFIAAFFIWRRLGAGYAIYTLLGILLPANSGSGSISRYILVLFPLFLMLGYWGKNRQLHNALIVGFSCLLGILTTIFVNWIFVA